MGLGAAVIDDRDFERRDFNRPPHGNLVGSLILIGAAIGIVVLVLLANYS